MTETPPVEEREEPRDSSNGSGGGCDAGMGVSAVAAALLAPALRRKNAA
jgi:hypothetical protein